MQKTLLITGSTDGIGLETARMLVSLGHHVLLHGRNPAKLEDVERTLSRLPNGGPVESYVADLSRMDNVEALAQGFLVPAMLFVIGGFAVWMGRQAGRK